mmetsp:Transcript_64358/g.106617  ORF Transcript_64358/g.106617 Transcript_64358/m.106617 type:complete len:211 (+) Transcript_64358:136-768(+)
MPLNAIIAKRPCLISACCRDFNFSGEESLKPPISIKSPGKRLPFTVDWMPAIPAISKTPQARSSSSMRPSATAMSCALNEVTAASLSSAGTPGARTPMSGKIQPMVASMHTRPCLTSASRIQPKCALSLSKGPSAQLEKPKGSKPTSPASSHASRLAGRAAKGSATDFEPGSAFAYKPAGAVSHGASSATTGSARRAAWGALMACPAPLT